MKKILILGSDFGTISVAKEAHRRGQYVIVADMMLQSPTKSEADESWLISTTDIDELEKRSRAAGVEAVMFGASDFNISNCRELCKRLGLPIYCDDDDVWARVRDKRVFKTVCGEVGAPVATDYLLTDEDYRAKAGNIAYPVVVKPSDKSGNRGMSFCDNVDEFVAAYQKARGISESSIIVERKLVGEEYNVHYTLAEGEASLLYFSSTHHEPGYPSNLYSFKCTTSNHLMQYIREVDALAKEVIKAMGCKEGIAWFDVMRDADGKFYLLEMGYRFGGVMTYMPYARVSGFDTVGWMLDIALGKRHKKSDLPSPLSHFQHGVAASYHLFAQHDGVVRSLCGIEEISKMQDVHIDIPKREGSSVRGSAGMGLIGVYAVNVDELCSTVAKINAVLAVKDEQGEDLVIKFDDYDTLRKEYVNGLKDFGMSL